jgi:hypothetical protein
MVVPRLFLAYLRNVIGPHRPKAYLISYPDAVHIGEAVDWLKTPGGREIGEPTKDHENWPS